MLALIRNIVAAWAPNFLYRLLTRQGRIEVGYEESIARKYLEKLSTAGVSLSGKSLVDIGSGDLVGHAPYLIEAGAAQVTLCDHHISAIARNRLTSFEFKHRTSGSLPVISIVQNQIETLSSFQDHSVDLITSNSLLEHVHDINQALDECRRVLVPGGLMLHFIDMRDHRNFSKPFTFLRYRKRIWEHLLTSSQSYTNRLRKSDYLSYFEQANFSVISCDSVSLPVSDKDFSKIKLSEDFLEYSKTDITTTELHVLLQAPK